ncbi:MAG: peptide-methionine (S)-S-oxide reductase MsrA [Saprospiraceae bacterium]
MNLFLSLSASILLTLGACANAQTDTSSGDKMNSTSQEGPKTTAAPDKSLPVAYFAGGCFWCTEASFERIEGVQAVVSGYTGGKKSTADYKLVSSGRTNHAEAIAIYYDAEVVSYRTLLDVFFVAHDPTTLDRQGPDAGPQYRSEIFFQTMEEEVLAKAVIDSVNTAGLYSNPIVTKLSKFEAYYDAEEYHQGYYELHPNNGYISNVSRPKVKKVEKRFKNILKATYKKA